MRTAVQCVTPAQMAAHRSAARHTALELRTGEGCDAWHNPARIKWCRNHNNNTGLVCRPKRERRIQKVQVPHTVMLARRDCAGCTQHCPGASPLFLWWPRVECVRRCHN